MTDNVEPTYAQLAKALDAFGYEVRRKGSHTIYQHPGGTQLIVLPAVEQKERARPVHLKVIENTIREDGIIAFEDFQFFLENGKTFDETIHKGDRLIWKAPGGGDIPVVAAAGEKDGLVIIKQKGAFSPCPVGELRKVVASKNGATASDRHLAKG